MLLDDPSRTTSRTDHLRCTYVDYLTARAGGDQDADAAVSLTKQLRANEDGCSSHVDVEMAARWLHSIRPRTRYDAAPMLTLAKALLEAMCSAHIKKVVGSVEETVMTCQNQAAQIQELNQLLNIAREQVEAGLASASDLRTRNTHLEEELRLAKEAYEMAETEAAAKDQARAAEIDDLTTRLRNKNKNFGLVQDELTKLMQEHQELGKEVDGDQPDETGSEWMPWKPNASPDTSEGSAESLSCEQADQLEVPANPAPGESESVHPEEPEIETSGTENVAKEVGVNTDDTWDVLTKSLETTQIKVAHLTKELETARKVRVPFCGVCCVGQLHTVSLYFRH